MGEGSRHQGVSLARALFPEVAAELDAALAGHGVDAGGEFDAWLDDAATRMLGGAGFDEVSDPAVAERFEQAFAAARAAAAGLGVSVPEPEAFAAAGADFARFEAAMTADPELQPVPAPYGLGPAPWQRAFDETGLGLVFANEALREFAALDAAPDAVAVESGGAAWVLRLVPAGQRPATLGLGFVHGPHAALPEMLMLQLMRAERGEAPVDAESFTWLAGSLADGRLAARHVYDASERTVRITCREVGSQGPHLGARPPVG